MKIRISFLLFFIYTVVSVWYSFAQERGLASITKNELREHILYLASDELEGRATGSQGQKKAASYLAGLMEKYGYDNNSNGDSFFQRFELYKGSFSDKSFITITRNGNKEKHTLGSGYFFNPLFNVNGEVEGILVFVGNTSVTMLTANLVMNKFTILGTASSLTSFDSKNFFRSLGPLIGNQPKGLFFIASAYDEVKWNNLTTINLFGETSLSSMKNRSPLEYCFPFVEVNRNFLIDLLGFSEEKTRTLVNKIEGYENITPFFVDDTEIEISIDFKEEKIESENVYGIMEGTDEDLKDEYIVIGAHYDHLGVLQGETYNGADDNASGTAALLEIAEALTMEKLKRSVMVVFFTAEEGGITGSEYFTSHFPGDLDKVFAYINLDMVGRSSGNRVYIIGGDLVSEGLGAVCDSMNTNYVHLTLDERYNSFDDPEQLYRRGDQIHFGKKDIPFIDFFTGLHPDYHKPTDDIGKIRWGDLERITKLAFLTCFEAANTEEEIKMDTKVPKKDY